MSNQRRRPPTPASQQKSSKRQKTSVAGSHVERGNDEQRDVPAAVSYSFVEDYFDIEHPGSKILLEMMNDKTKVARMEANILNGSHYEIVEALNAQSASELVGRNLDNALEVLESKIALVRESKGTKADLDQQLSEMSRMIKPLELDPSEYTVKVVKAIVRGISFRNDTLDSVGERTGLHSVTEIQKIMNKDVLVAFLVESSKGGLSKNREFQETMAALKDDGCFWRTSFQVNTVLCNKKYSRATLQSLLAMYYKADGYRDLAEPGHKFELSKLESVNPWSNDDPSLRQGFVPPSPGPQIAASPGIYQGPPSRASMSASPGIAEALPRNASMPAFAQGPNPFSSPAPSPAQGFSHAFIDPSNLFSIGSGGTTTDQKKRRASRTPTTRRPTHFAGDSNGDRHMWTT